MNRCVSVVQYGDMPGFESARGQFRIGVMIVIAEHGPNAFRRIQRRKCFGARLDKATIRSAVIAGEHKHIRLCLLRETNHASHLAETKDAAVMNVRELSDAKALEPFWQITDKDVGFRNPISVRLDEACVGRSR